MAEKFNLALRSARELKGLDANAGKMFGLSANEWYDLEQHVDEWSMVTPAYVIRCIVSYFELDWPAFYDWPSGVIRVPTSRDQGLDGFIRKIREKNNLSREDFSDRVGFNATFAEVIEGHPEGLLLWPLEPAMLLARAFDIDGRSLAGRLLKPYW